MDVGTDKPWAGRFEATGSLPRGQEAIGIQVPLAEGLDTGMLLRHRLGRVREDPEVYERRMPHAWRTFDQELE